LESEEEWTRDDCWCVLLFFSLYAMQSNMIIVRSWVKRINFNWNGKLLLIHCIFDSLQILYRIMY